MESLASIINYGADAIREIFDRHGLEQVPVTEKNVANAVQVLPEVKQEIAAAFDGYDNAGGKLKAKLKGKKLDLSKVGTALATAGAIAGTAAAIQKGGQAQTEAEAEPEPEKKATPTVFGFNAYLFWSVVVIIILIIVLVAVKALRK